MGLDTVELVVAIEEEFGLGIPDEEAERLATVGDVYEWLKVRIATADPQTCLTQRIFYKLRTALIQNYGVKRQAINSETRLTDLLSLEAVEAGWPSLQLFIDLKTPPFRVANELLGLRLSKQSLTMRQLVQSLISLNDSHFASMLASEQDIWNRLVLVIFRQANVNLEEIRYESSFTKDLRLD
jgi:hypothetical protein